MRLRNVKGAREAMAESRFVIQNPQQYKGKWAEVFQNQNPIHIEVGMGKGKFITTLAQQNPNINYIGIEKYSSVLIRAFGMGEVERIYLNFSDPWPKDRHAKRRLTSKEYFARYDQILEKTGQVEFKTDNQDLFTFSLESVKEAGWYLEMSTRDYHNSPYVEGNVMTEYEEKFSSIGNPICKLIAKR